MKNNPEIIESLLEKATDYGKTSLELIKLQAIDKTSDKISSLAPYSALIFVSSCFLLFLNLGVALWLGEVFGKIYLGFFTVAGFYVVVGLIMYFFMRKWIKRVLNDFIIKQLLN